MNRARKQLIGLVSLFAIPTIASWFFIYNPEFLPSAKSNQGTLLQPVIKIDNFEFKNINNQTANSLSKYTNYWTFILIAGSQCDDVCKQKIHDMHQIRKALEENYTRVKRLVLVSSNHVDADLKHYLRPYHGTDVMSQDKALSDQLIKQLGNDKDITNYTFIMDPMHNVMMSYTPKQNPKSLLSDLKHLLKFNQWGAGH